MMTHPGTPDTVVFQDGVKFCIDESVKIMNFCVLGVKNPYPDDFENEEQKIVRIGARCVIYPWSMLYEGAVVDDDVQIGERCTVGSRTHIGNHSRLVYGAQVHDNVVVGEWCVIGGIVADNCAIGKKCSIFGDLVHRYEQHDPSKWDVTDEPGPTLADNVLVGWGAVVVGPVRIGSGARIFPNAVVTEDVSPGKSYGKP